MVTILHDRIVAEIERLQLQSRKLDESYKSSKIAVEERIRTLGKLLPMVTPEVEQLIEALGIAI